MIIRLSGQIVVKHVTVNADLAVVAESITTGNKPGGDTVKLVAANADKPMEPVEQIQNKAVPVGGGAKEK